MVSRPIQAPFCHTGQQRQYGCLAHYVQPAEGRFNSSVGGDSLVDSRGLPAG